MGNIKIKVHNVMHDETEYNVSTVEEFIESWITSYDIINVRIAQGHNNSPIFVTVDEDSLNLKNVKSIARNAVDAFSEFADGVDVDNTINERNILITKR